MTVVDPIASRELLPEPPARQVDELFRRSGYPTAPLGDPRCEAPPRFSDGIV
jgi:hypothetical protein